MYSGCIEPPVTPVGRDELELKRQRLYTELLRAAHAAVEHSVAVRGMTDSSDWFIFGTTQLSSYFLVGLCFKDHLPFLSLFFVSCLHVVFRFLCRLVGLSFVFHLAIRQPSPDP